MAVSRRTESPAVRQRRLRRLPRAGRPYVADLASCWRSGEYGACRHPLFVRSPVRFL